jgi:pimeloyl-ACP methyl ester carboxylesterase
LILSGISFTGCDMQHNMLYFPDSRLPSESELTTKGLQFWPTGPIGYRGYISTGGIKDIKGTIIVFHGNAGTAADRDYYLSALCSMGYRVILAEYPGYGGRKGRLDEQSFVNDSRETLHIAAEKYKGPIYLLGESLGCGVVAGVARDTSPGIAGIILITPWNTLLAVAKDYYPYLPVGWFMKDRYDNAENLESFQGKIAVVGAERDEVVPVRHAKELFTLLPGDKRMWIIKGAGHNNWSMLIDRSEWQEIMDFISH